MMIKELEIEIQESEFQNWFDAQITIWIDEDMDEDQLIESII